MRSETKDPAGKASEGECHLFTFVLDYAGGTYLSQFQAADLNSAVMQFSCELEEGRLIPDFEHGPSLALELARDVPVAVDGLQHVWCITGVCENELGVLHVVGLG
ncbi:MAG: hypothetical protein ACYTG5_19060 [Planctomycetota bacterium]|jgi:hypothetical protein